MRRLAVALLLLLPACLEYEIKVTTVVKADGSVRRTLVIREKQERKTWERFESPAAPYATEGSDEEGFLATADLKAGRHPAGLRVRLGDAEPAAEGTVTVETKDLLVATLYRYEERIAIGADLARFRAELPKRLDLGLRFTIETLRIHFPEIDFAPVEERARAEFLPALERTILGTLVSARAVLAESRGRGLRRVADDRLLKRELVALLVGEFAPLGVSVVVPEGPPWDDHAMEALPERAGRQLAERFLAPLDEAQRARVIDAMFSDALEEAADVAAEKLFPTEEARNRFGKEMQAFASSVLGAYLAYGLFDSFHLVFRVELPGRPLRANGDLSRVPTVEWRLEQGDLVLAPPVLFATSVRPREGVSGEGWNEATLDGIEEALAEVPPEQRLALEEVVAKALRIGWPEDAPLEKEARDAYAVLREAAAPEPPPAAK